MVLGHRRAKAGSACVWPHGHRSRARGPRPLLAVMRRFARVAVHRKRVERGTAVASAERFALCQRCVPRIRRIERSRLRESGSRRDQGRRALFAGRTWRRQRGNPPAVDNRTDRQRLSRLRPDRQGPDHRRGRVLRAHHAAGAHRRRAPRPSPGAGRHVVGQAVPTTSTSNSG